MPTSSTSSPSATRSSTSSSPTRPTRYFLPICREKFDIIFADPPYALEGLESIPDKVLSRDLLHPGCYFILEHGGEHSFTGHPLFKKEKVYGRVHFSFFEK